MAVSCTESTAPDAVAAGIDGQERAAIACDAESVTVEYVSTSTGTYSGLEWLLDGEPAGSGETLEATFGEVGSYSVQLVAQGENPDTASMTTTVEPGPAYVCAPEVLTGPEQLWLGGDTVGVYGIPSAVTVAQPVWMIQRNAWDAPTVVQQGGDSLVYAFTEPGNWDILLADNAQRGEIRARTNTTVSPAEPPAGEILAMMYHPATLVSSTPAPARSRTRSARIRWRTT